MKTTTKLGLVTTLLAVAALSAVVFVLLRLVTTNQDRLRRAFRG